MLVDPKIEEPARTLIGHVIRQEWDELEAEVRRIGDDTYNSALVLCILVAGYVAVDVAGHWPTDADVRFIAQRTAKSARGFELAEEDVYAFLSQVALDWKPMVDVFPSAEVGLLLPLQVTSTLLLAFLPKDKRWWEYLDVIENSLDASEYTNLALLPALSLRASWLKDQAKQRRSAAPAADNSGDQCA